MIPFASAYWHLRRKMADDQNLPRRKARRLPMWRLLAGEVAWAARRMVRRVTGRRPDEQKGPNHD